MAMTLNELIDAYWDCAYREGKDGRTHDTPSGDAQRIRSQIDAHLSAQAGVRVMKDDVDVAIEAWDNIYDGVSHNKADAIRACLESFAVRLPHEAYGENEEDRCVICKCLIRDADGGLCDEHKYDDSGPGPEICDHCGGYLDTGMECNSCGRLSAQAKVRVNNAGLPRELRLVCGHDSRSVENCIHCEAADALESFAACVSQGAQGESTVSEDEWVHKLEKRVEFLESLLPAERAAVPDVDRMRNALDWIAENTVASHAFDDSLRIIHNVARNALSGAALTAAPQPPEGARVVDGWQPIETAPKGGKDILIWNEASAMLQIALWVPTMGCWLTDEDHYVDSDELSHWHPLPAAPTLAGKEG